MTGAAILLDRVSRKYGSIAALRDVSLGVPPGQRLALLGHNGAGKTTLLKLVLGLIRPDSGSLEVLGRTPADISTRRLVAYLPENVAFHNALTAREQLNLYLRLKGGDRRTGPAILERVGLAEAADRRIGGFSKGMRQRLGLAQILIGQPGVVILDEPTSGLDPVSRELFYEIIADLSANGAAIIQSSHALTEVEARNDRIVILRNGEMVADGRLAELQAKTRLPIRVRVRTEPNGAAELVSRIGGTRLNGTAVELTCTAEDKLRCLADVTSLGALVEDVDVVPPSLEEVYRFYSGTADREGAET